MAFLRYPYAAITSKTDYLQLDIIKYEAPGPGLVSVAGRRRPVGRGNTINQQITSGSARINDSILLPMPANIQDGNSVKFADDSLNGIIATAVKEVGSSMTVKNAQELFSNRGGIANLLDLAGSEEVKQAVLRSLAAQAVNIFGGNVTPDQILARQRGEIFNPNMELLFNGVTLRAFKFSFKMTPRNAKESDQVKYIIRSLKRNMAAQSGANNYYLKTPNIFELRYKRGNEDHPFLHKFKQCALTDISVNYTGENVYATYGDATPVSMVMDLTFRELEPIYASDYVDSNGGDLDTTVGY